jgi:hypothetical protein
MRPYVLLLQELLCEIFQVSATELGSIRNNNDLPLLTRNSDVVSQISRSIVYLDSVVEEFLKGRRIEDFIVRWCRCIENVLSSTPIQTKGSLLFGIVSLRRVCRISRRVSLLHLNSKATGLGLEDVLFWVLGPLLLWIW